ncbi:MAG: 16S rRNA (guanine(966)-N(2))-methyltransferase RsmD [Rhodospirillaceae bacterium]|nr:16S rRNA (guanine(966)-N(2))-methyltransferase RsmD [Rhodospirillaceae bacterium]
MRIVGGKHRGRPLAAPKGRSLRPTADRTRESVFNILAHSTEWDGFDGITVLDVFCGTGALALEALSRGAAKAVLIDSDMEALKFARENADSLGEAQNIMPLKLDATRLAPPPRTANGPLPLAFLDAPYSAGLTGPALMGLEAKGWLAPGAMVVAEISADETLPIPPGYQLLDERTYGAAKIMFLRFLDA